MAKSNKTKSSARTLTQEQLSQKINAVVELVGTEVQGRWTPLGSTAKAENGRIEMAILNGATTLQELAEAIGNPNTRKSDPNDFGKACLRVKEHLNWIVSGSTAHKGFLHAMGRVHKYPIGKGKKCMKHLKGLNDKINTEFRELFDSKGLPKATSEA